MSKTEKILNKMLNDEDLSNYVPQSELELWLKNIALGEGNENTPAKSRATKLLKQIALGGGTGGIIPEGVLEIIKNGTYDVTRYASANVNVHTSGGSGGGEVGDGYKIRYIDVDGTVLKTEYVESGGKLTPPSNPTYDSEYLEFDTWNYDIDNYIVDGNTDVGAIYRTKTGDSYLFIKLTENIGLTIPEMKISGATSIDWGDGTINTNLTHTYANYGDYVIKISGMTRTTSYLFGSSSSVYNYCLQKCYLGDTVTSIGSNMFSGCYTLSSIAIPNGVKSVSGAFFNCRSLSNVNIPDTVTRIAGYSFKNCYTLSSITIPNGVTSIGNQAFVSCYSLTSITIPNGVTSIENDMFQNCYSLLSVTIPNSVTSIGSGVFSACYSLSNVTIPNGVTSIAGSAFQNCHSLSSIVIPNTVTSIGDQVFSGCYSLLSVTIPNGVTSIGNTVFHSCYSLTSITIPNTVTSIGSNMFYDCYSIKDYIFNCTSVPTLVDTNVFSSINKSAIIWVKDELVESYKSATNWSTYATYIKPISAMPQKLKEELGVL